MGRDSVPAGAPARSSAARRLGVGGFFLVMGGVHLGLVSADAEVYRHFADGALFPFVRHGWRDIVMVRPELFGLLLMAGEIAMGTLLILGGRFARPGWIAVIVFHLLLLLFGWGFWMWAVPAIAVLVRLGRDDLVSGDGGE